MGKRDVQSSREDHVVFLRASRRIGDVDVAELILPSQPFVDLRDRSEIERGAVLPGLLKIRDRNPRLCVSTVLLPSFVFSSSPRVSATNRFVTP